MAREQRPHSEPEIIPPGYSDRASMRGRYRLVDLHGTRRVYAVRVGPFGFVSLVLLIAVIATVMFFVLLGAVLLWIPIVILLIAGTIISGLLRR